MALINLKSDLSWYGKKPPTTNVIDNTDQKGFDANIMPIGSSRPESRFVGIKGIEYTSTSLLGTLSVLASPSTDYTDTKFVLDGASPSISISGFANDGSLLGPRIVMARDAFAHDTFSNSGDAKRANQLGQGTKFPISPQGNNHGFDLTRLGFHESNRYSDLYGVKHKYSGLANTYTENSPIDDMYNKFNLRDDATPQLGYIKHPLILRGIQREGKSDPQRWGLGGTVAGAISSTFDVPRGGVLTALERGVVDVVRVAKFIASPKGLSWGIKQFGLQLTGPNLEGSDGTTRKVLGKNSPKLWMPTSTLLQPLGILAGVHMRRTGLLPLDIPLIDPHNYEDVVNSRAGKSVSNNRLVNILDELLPKPNANGGLMAAAGAVAGAAAGVFGLKMPIKVLSGKTGPDSILGLGRTNISRFSNSSIKEQLSSDFKEFTGGLGGLTYDQYITRYNTYTNPYQKTRGETISFSVEDIDSNKDSKKKSFGGRKGAGFDPYGLQTHKSLFSLASKNQPRPDGSRTRFDGGGSPIKDDLRKEVDHTGYETNDYETLLKQSKDRPTLASGLDNDFLADEINTYDGSDEKSRILNTSAYRVIGAPPLADRVQSGDAESQKTDNSGPLTVPEKGYYKVLGYANLTRDDVRSFSGDAKKGLGGTKYGGDSTLIGKYGYNSFPATRTKIEDQGDPIQSLEGDYAATDKDLINFKFQALRTTDSIATATENPIVFRAFINSINDSFAPSWNENQDQGRADAKIMLSGWARSISLDFVVPVQSAAELDPVYKKLERLAKLTYPIYAGSGFTGTYCKTTIGDLYKGEAMYVSDLSYDWDNETPWELVSGKQLPFYTNVSMTLGWIGKQRPEYNTHVFTYNAST